MVLLQLLLALAPLDPDAFARDLAKTGAANVRVRRVQLDRDAPLEAIVQWEMPDTGAHAAVLDPAGPAWRELARFNTWWSYLPADGERLIETRPLVDPAVQDLLVRVKSGETEHVRHTLTAYRLREGKLLPVLEIKESETAMEHPSGDVFTTTAAVTFAPGRVTVRTKREPGGRTGCALHVWNEDRFRFDERPCDSLADDHRRPGR